MKCFKSVFVSSVILMSTMAVNLQAQEIWEKSFGGSGTRYAYSVIKTSDSGYLVAGLKKADSKGTSFGNDDVWILKLDSNGNYLWDQTYGGSGNDAVADVKETSDGGFILAGWSDSDSINGVKNHGFGTSDAWIIKLKVDGSLDWQKFYGGSGKEAAYKIFQTSDATSSYIFAGQTNSTDTEGNVQGRINNDDDAWIVKIDSVGNIIWEQSFGGNGMDAAYSIKPTNDPNKYIFAGWSSSTDLLNAPNHGGYDAWVANISSDGTKAGTKIEWQDLFGGTGSFDAAYDVIQDSDDDFVMIGETNSSDGDVVLNNAGKGALLVKISPTGEKRWSEGIVSSNRQWGSSIQPTSDGGYIFAGTVMSSTNDSDALIVKLVPNSQGNVEWEKTFGDRGNEQTRAIQNTEDGKYVFTGWADSLTNPGATNYWIVKFDSSKITNIQDPFNKSDKTAIYPNPPQGALININTTDMINVNITVATQQGNIVYTGNGTTVDTSGLSEGTYFINVYGTEKNTGKKIKRVSKFVK